MSWQNLLRNHVLARAGAGRPCPLPVPAGTPVGWPRARVLPLPRLTHPLNHSVPSCQPGPVLVLGRGGDSRGQELFAATDAAPTAWHSEWKLLLEN